MTICPKCGSSNIIGPKFVRTWHGEALRYACGRCGYPQDEPTKDNLQEGLQTATKEGR